ncbi:MAG: AbrB/MazE/SpoVT family DNA-binding domain-containing protein [Burkholderiales bacterium]|nr:AbrB/MazE/SpoVT family DNA-binding domain-containing protein [Burkholderiales bacterium]
MRTLKLTRIGNAVGIILPKEVRARLRLERGARVFLTETPQGIALTPYDEALGEQLNAGREVMQYYHATFQKLAE